MQFTQKEKLAQFDELHKHSELLELYLYDTQHRRKPDTWVKRPIKHGDPIRFELWRATSASGGYVVMKNGQCNIWLLDDLTAKLQKDSYMYGEDARSCIAELNIARQRIWDAEKSEIRRPLP